MSLNAITVSGISSIGIGPVAYVTYDSNQLGYGLPWPNAGNMDLVPNFMYFAGDVQYFKDAAGNVIAKNV